MTVRYRIISLMAYRSRTLILSVQIHSPTPPKKQGALDVDFPLWPYFSYFVCGEVGLLVSEFSKVPSGSYYGHGFVF